ncbi:ABC transporter substrate-binding protein [Eubacterium sp. MSJ-13]|uniref:ABC transporter substrate-binding protein n=1 Tax=Eubacterium sp. MSJ-13 TaxID=2841513 RepID=UPI001C105324|nr:ABC transporter substrate-binding protein [Eubacterium sp. MSJ-13]MBU5479487.1 ABC transporter substrate-binding protein [Eubacterium sp. MSJ-13]
MKKRLLLIMTALLAVLCMAGCGSEKSSESGKSDDKSKTYKVGIVQYVDDASLNQIQKAVQSELDKKGEELGVKFDYKDYTFNGQADQSTLNQIMTELVSDEVDIIIPIATPTALIAQSATEDNQIPVVFSAVTDPVSAGLVSSMDKPGANITGTSDAIDTQAIMKLILNANSKTKKIGLLYDKSQDSSKQAIADAKKFCEDNSIEVVEKTGTTNDELSLAADALVAAKVDAVFTPTDNTVMTAELAIYEKFANAKIPHYTGADSFALNGAFVGYGVNYKELGTETADMAVDILVNGAKPGETAVKTLDNGITTVNTEIAEQIGVDYSGFKDLCEKVVETKTAKEFDEN